MDFIQKLNVTALNYNVNFYIFAVIYVASIPVFYYALYRVISTFKKSSYRLTSENNINLLFLSFSWLSPYLYVFFFGKNLPTWIIVLIVIVLVTSFMLTVRNIFKDRGVNEN